MLPYSAWLPFKETRKFWRNVRVINDVVTEIIGKKRQQLRQGEGSVALLFSSISHCNQPRRPPRADSVVKGNRPTPFSGRMS